MSEEREVLADLERRLAADVPPGGVMSVFETRELTHAVITASTLDELADVVCRLEDAHLKAVDAGPRGDSGPLAQCYRRILEEDVWPRYEAAVTEFMEAM